MGIYLKENSIILENKYSEIYVSLSGLVEKVFDKTEKNDIKGEDTYFFYLIGEDRETKIYPNEIILQNDIISVKTSVGDFSVKAEAQEEYFTFELVTPLPENSYKAVFAHIKYNYNYEERKTGAVGVAMTYSVNPCFFPDGKNMETKGEVLSYLKNDGAKYALIIAPVKYHREIIKKVCDNIDPNKGITLKTGGAFADDCRLNKGNWIMQFDNSKETVKKSIPFYKELGVDIVDYHKQYHEVDKTFIQGDFKHLEYETAEEFKKSVIYPLEENGMIAGLHTYAYLIDFKCDTLLKNPEYQKDLTVLGEFTAKEFDGKLIKVEENIDDVTHESGFVMNTSPYLLIKGEIVKFEKCDEGFLIVNRSLAGTKEVSIEKGDKFSQLSARFGGFIPKLGSPLFFKVAENTAKVYNEYGYRALYIDALDAVLYDCNRNEDEMAYYMSLFTCALLKDCIIPPVYDCSIRRPCLWASRGRVGNFDTPYRGYKAWNKMHSDYAHQFQDMYMSPSLGWYSFYREPEKINSGNFDTSKLKVEPANFDKKYQHHDSVHYIGSLALINNCSMTFIEITEEEYKECPARNRNIKIYKEYDNLRKSGYFSKELLESLKYGKYEYHLEKKSDGEYILREKDYQIKKLYDLCGDINKGEFDNPFEKQTPFVRIEALLSAKNECSEKCVKLEGVMTNDRCHIELETPVDLSDTLARKVKVTGNGKKGGAIGIKLRSFGKSAKQYMLYVIDTSFVGEREFVLIENDAGEFPSYGFDKGEWNYATHRFSLYHNKVEIIDIDTKGDTKGVKISDMYLSEHIYETIKNPTILIGKDKVEFLCDLKSTEYIEFDGKCAKVIDGMGNEREIEFKGSLTVPKGNFSAQLAADSLSGNVLRAQLTFGFSGKAYN